MTSALCCSCSIVSQFLDLTVDTFDFFQMQKIRVCTGRLHVRYMLYNMLPFHMHTTWYLKGGRGMNLGPRHAGERAWALQLFLRNSSFRIGGVSRLLCLHCVLSVYQSLCLMEASYDLLLDEVIQPWQGISSRQKQDRVDSTLSGAH